MRDPDRRPKQEVPSRVPLFPVSLAFASGCILGLATPCPQVVAVGLFQALLVIWLWLNFRGNPAALPAFFLMVGAGGLLHTVTMAMQIPGDDVRAVSTPVRNDSLTAWLAVVEDEPVNTPSRNPHFSPPHQALILELRAWHAGDPDAFRHFPTADETVPDWHTVTGTVTCHVVQPAVPFKLGDMILLTGALEPIPSPLTPGESDNRALQARAGIFFRLLSSGRIRLISQNQVSSQRRFSLNARDWVYHQLHVGIDDDPETADTLTGMLIGYRQNLPLDVEDDFRRTGTLHVFAVSGQNVSEIGKLCILFLSFLVVRWRWAWAMAPLIITFCLITGSQGSAVRATLMGLLLITGWWLGRPVQVKGLWSLALLGMTVWDPTVLLDPGTELSFGVVWGIMTFTGPFSRPFVKHFRPDPFIPNQLIPLTQRYESKFWQGAISLIAASAAATLVSEPIAGLIFHQVTPVSVLANLIVVPTAGLITSVGTLSIAFSSLPLGGTLTAWSNNSNWCLAKFLIWFVHVAAHEPGSSIYVPDLQALRETTPSCTVFPLESGAAMLVRLPNGDAWLFNSGRDTEARFTTARVCQYYGINRLAGLVLLQVNTEANGGESLIDQTLSPARVALPILRTRTKIQKQVEQQTALESWQAGDTISLNPTVTAEVLWPQAPDPETPSEFTHAQDRALVVRLIIHSGKTTFSLLWVGECRAAVRDRLLELNPQLHADVVVLSTADAPTDSEVTWVNQLHPTAWIHFHQDVFVLRPATPTGLLYWPLEQNGAITFCINPDGIRTWTLPK